MRKGKPKGKGVPAEKRPAQGPVERAGSLLLRLETGGPNPVKAAEELDRLQGALERAGSAAEIRDRIADLCDAWLAQPLRGERAQAWLTLVGGFGLREYTREAAALAEDGAVPSPIRIQAARVLAAAGGEEASSALQAVLLSQADPQVRAAAAEGLGDLRNPLVRPVLEALLEEDLPRNVWTAASTALDRLR